MGKWGQRAEIEHSRATSNLFHNFIAKRSDFVIIVHRKFYNRRIQLGREIRSPPQILSKSSEYAIIIKRKCRPKIV